MQLNQRSKRQVYTGATLIAVAVLWGISSLIFIAIITHGSMKLYYISQSASVIGAIVITIYVAELFVGIPLLIAGLANKKKPAVEDPGIGQVIAEGEREAEPILQVEADDKPCPACGEPNPAENIFCEQCGASLS